MTNRIQGVRYQQCVNSEALLLVTIVATIKSMRPNKAQGVNCIPVEILTGNPALLAQMLYQLISNIRETESLPVDWMLGIFVNAFKKQNVECGY